MRFSLSTCICFVALIVVAQAQGFQTISYSEPYTFVVAGHVYGSPREKEIFLDVYPPFRKEFVAMKDDESVQFAVFTGDVVRGKSRGIEWDTIAKTEAEFNKPIYIAPGNHEFYVKGEFKERFGKTHDVLHVNDDLFLILNNITAEEDDDQFQSIKEALEEEYRHIFVFFHNMLWSYDSEFSFLKYWINHTRGGDGSDLWKQLKPLLSKRVEAVYIFAGDLGCKMPLVYTPAPPMYLIGSGMCGSAGSNYLKVTIDGDNVEVYSHALDGTYG